VALTTKPSGHSCLLVAGNYLVAYYQPVRAGRTHHTERVCGRLREVTALDANRGDRRKDETVGAYPVPSSPVFGGR